MTMLAEGRETAAHLTAACQCGKTAAAPCPSPADVSSAVAAIKALGWGWYGGIGFACSPACAAAREADLARRQGRVARDVVGSRRRAA